MARGGDGRRWPGKKEEDGRKGQAAGLTKGRKLREREDGTWDSEGSWWRWLGRKRETDGRDRQQLRHKWDKIWDREEVG